jgi:hypothetical protein
MNRKRSLDDVPGWLKTTDMLLFEWLLTTAGPSGPGDLLEIGVFQGKSAIHIGRFRREGETFWVCDLFDLARDEMSIHPGARRGYADLTQETFERNYLSFHDKLPVIVRGKSESIVDHVRAGSLRFAHIDGSHMYEHVRQDLLSARTLLRPDGVVVFDDYRTEHCPGTAAAVWEGAISEGLRPICVSANKFYGTWGDPDPIQERIIELVDRRADHRLDVQDVLGRRLIRVFRVAKRAAWLARPAASAVPAKRWRRVAVAVLPPVITHAIRARRHW